MNDKVSRVYWTLRITFGVVPIVAGLDKFTNLLADWTAYLSPLAASLLPFSPSTFMHLVGLVEIAAGILVLARPRIGAYVAAVWLALIALNLLTTGHYLDVAVRDLVMAVSAFCLGRLAEVHDAAAAPAGEGLRHAHA